jgi:hypothetical protein
VGSLAAAAAVVLMVVVVMVRIRKKHNAKKHTLDFSSRRRILYRDNKNSAMNSLADPTSGGADTQAPSFSSLEPFPLSIRFVISLVGLACHSKS